ncbi:MAG: hypothetical protein WCK90_01045 [archaeon]
MSSEYIRFVNPQVKFGQKTVLEAQLSLLNSMKHMREYKRLRDQELILKIHLRKKIEEAKTSLELLDHALPKSQFREEKNDAESLVREAVMVPSILHEERRDLSLEQELEKVKRRLALIR